MIYSNLHTHTNFCDGEAPPQSFVERAIELGFKTIGFSAHSCLSIYEGSLPEYDGYIKEILKLKKIYADKIFVSLGLERDIFSEIDSNNYDYVIGSTHFVKKADDYLPVDYSAQQFDKIINEHYNGVAMNFVRDYYETESKIIKKTNANIVGHFDIIKKYNYGNKFFDEDSKEYKDIAICALDAVMEDADVFEINSGAIARGANPIPYPNIFLLKRLKQKGKKIIISSDAHSPQNLNSGFDISLSLARQAGFDSVLELTQNGFIETKI